MTDNENQTQTCDAKRPGTMGAIRCVRPIDHAGNHSDYGTHVWPARPSDSPHRTPLQETSDRVTATLEAEQRAARADATASRLAQAVLDAGEQVLAAEAELSRVREQRDRLEQRANQARVDRSEALDQRDRLAEAVNEWRTTARGLLGGDLHATPDQLAAYVEGLVVALDQAKSCVSVNVTLDPERLHWTAAKTMAARNPRPDNFVEGIACGVRTAHARGVWRECDLEADHDGPHESSNRVPDYLTATAAVIAAAATFASGISTATAHALNDSEALSLAGLQSALDRLRDDES